MIRPNWHKENSSLSVLNVFADASLSRQVPPPTQISSCKISRKDAKAQRFLF